MTCNKGKFSSEWKKINVQKNDKQSAYNFCLITFFPIRSTVFGHLLYEVCLNSSLIICCLRINPKLAQVTLAKNSYCQLLMIFIDVGLEVRKFFPDISKAFDIIWQKGLISNYDKIKYLAIY